MAATLDQTISPADALWALYQVQSKKVKSIFRKKLLEEELKEKESLNDRSFLSVASQVRQEYKEGKVTTCNTLEEIEAHLDSL